MISWCRMRPSTSKYTGKLPAWPRRMLLFGLRRLMMAATDLLSQEMFTFSKLIANYDSLACTCLKAVSVPLRRACAFVIGGLRGFMQTCLLSKTFHLNRWKKKIVFSRKTNLWLKKFCPKTNKHKTYLKYIELLNFTYACNAVMCHSIVH